MRRLVILLLLLIGLQLILPLGDPGRGSEWLLTFGFLILAAYSAGEIAAGVGLPKIIGFMVAGIVFGPSALGVVTAPASDALAPVSQLAIALIAFLAGAELRWEEVRARAGTILRIMTAELGVTFVAVATLAVLLLPRLPAFSEAGWVELAAFGLLFASIAIVHSPAVTMAILTETGATGPVARTTLGVVLLADVVVVVLFSAVLALTRAVLPPSVEESTATGVGVLIWELSGAVVVGAVLGALVALYLRFVRQELLFLAIMVALAGAAIAQALHVETLLMLLVAGFVTENVSRPEAGAELRHAMQRSSAPIFTVFFALAGTKVILGDIGSAGVLVLPIVLMRGLGIALGTRVGARWAGVPSEGSRVWMGLVSQAGVAVGLASLLAEAYPLRGGQLQAVFLGVIACNELVGAVLFRRALVRAGEVAPVSPDGRTSSVT